ncbi:MAG: hypothetical protein ACI37Q_07270 [Candidatus Gastranaerophilaceae bacterium]
MKKFHLNLYLFILNLLLFLCIFIISLAWFVVACIAPNAILPNCLTFLGIFLKIFLLFIFFSLFEKFYPQSTISKIANDLKSNKSSRKSALLLAFGCDAVIMFGEVVFFSMKSYRIEWLYTIGYEMISLGGVCMFYILLFGIWKIQDKIKQK